MDGQDDGLAERRPTRSGLVRRRVRGDLERFKQMIESQGTETGGWRGEVRPGGSGAPS